ncbi:putative cadherin-23-like [Azoarcus sp. CIB]|nr:putative cadherin-23-like [Azoarcus sp. CIB]
MAVDNFRQRRRLLGDTAALGVVRYKRHRLTPNRQQHAPIVTNWNQSSPIGAKRHQLAPSATNWHQLSPVGYNRHQLPPIGYNRHQLPPIGYNRHQLSPVVRLSKSVITPPGSRTPSSTLVRPYTRLVADRRP